MTCVPVKDVFPTARRDSKLPMTPIGDKRRLSEDGWMFFLSPPLSLYAFRQKFTQGQMATAAKPQITAFMQGRSHPKTTAIRRISDSLWWGKLTAATLTLYLSQHEQKEDVWLQAEHQKEKTEKCMFLQKHTNSRLSCVVAQTSRFWIQAAEN